MGSDAIEQLRRSASNLLLYRGVLESYEGMAWRDLIIAVENDDFGADELLAIYHHWFYCMADLGKSWFDRIAQQVVDAQNPFTLAAEKYPYAKLPPALVSAAARDLQKLQTIAKSMPVIYDAIDDRVRSRDPSAEPILTWDFPVDLQSDNLPPDIRSSRYWQEQNSWVNSLADLAAYHHRYGTGDLAKYRAFSWRNDDEFVGLMPITNPDPITIDSLFGFEEQKEIICRNTQYLLDDLPALNILLYGGRGTGKSSLVKSLLDRFAKSPLRLIEINKNLLTELPRVIEQIVDHPQKYIIFIDDLSFEEDDEAFKALKVVLEGSITAKPQNAIVYATTNRRHLVREYFADRPRPSDADEIHSGDTLQEKLSFSDRFGLTLTFLPTDQDRYLHIVNRLAERAKISLESAEISARALQWATRHNGRSGRTAKQFIDYLKATVSSS
jgi:predicted AAA+ superfamily ATPase